MDIPTSEELYNLPRGVIRQIEYTVDDNNHAGVFSIYLEDHTVGNLLKHVLLQNKDIRFAGYRKPHPLENKIEVKIHGGAKVDPKNSLYQTCQELKIGFDNLMKDFQDKVDSIKNPPVKENAEEEAEGEGE